MCAVSLDVPPAISLVLTGLNSAKWGRGPIIGSMEIGTPLAVYEGCAASQDFYQGERLNCI